MLLEVLPFFASSLLIVLFNYVQMAANYQQLIIVFLVILLILGLNKFKNLEASSFYFKALRTTLIFFGSLSVQLIVTSSGGFYSPLIILLHIFTLVLSFLLSFGSATIFLIFSLAVLLAQLRLNPAIHNIFINDPWSLSLYILSFLIIIPLIHTASNKYLVKDRLSRKLGDYLTMTRSREESFLQALNEATFIMDRNLKIISVNEAAEKNLKLPSFEIINQNLLQVVNLTDNNGQRATPDSLYVKQILEDGASRTISGFYFNPPGKSEPERVVIQIRPVVGSENNVDQIIVVISPERLEARLRHPVQSEILLRSSAIALQLDKEFESKGLSEIKSKFDYLIKSDQDVLLSEELEDHPIIKELMLQDIALLAKKVVESKKAAAVSVGAFISYKLPEGDTKEISYQKLMESSPALVSETAFSDYALMIDVKWFQIMVSKLMDICILLGSDRQGSEIEIKISKDEQLNVLLEIGCIAKMPDNVDLQRIFFPYYKDLADQTNLKYGTGLEGYIAKMIGSELGIEIRLNYQKIQKRFSFLLILPKIPITKN